MNIVSKVCVKCKQEKPISEFGKNKKSLDGYWHTCQLCIRFRYIPVEEYIEKLSQGLHYCVRCKAWKPVGEFQKRTSDILGISSRCIICHRGISRETARKYRKAYVAKGSEWRRNNREKHLETRKKWRAKPENAERERARYKAWAKTHYDNVKELLHRRRARIAKNGGSYTPSEWKLLCAKYDYKCLRCGEKKPLTPDHVIPISRGGTNNIDNIQPLCKSCNCKKHARKTDYRDGKEVDGYYVQGKLDLFGDGK